MRFVLDNDVAVTVRRVLLDAGHECWTAADANLDEAPDDALAVYAADRSAALISHDAEFARLPTAEHDRPACLAPLRRAARTPAVLGEHLAEIVDALRKMPDMVIEVRPGSVTVSPPRWD